MVDRLMALQGCPFLIPRTLDFVILHGKRDFDDEIKDLEMQKLS